MKSSAHKISVSLLIIFLVGTSLSLLPTTFAQYYPLSQNTLNVVVNYSGAGYVTPGSGLYNYGSTVTARVYTNTGYVFDGWYLNGVYQGKLTTIPITMTQDYTLYAVFSIRTVCLTINSNPTEGGTTAPGAGIWNYTYGSSITVSEYPSSGCNFSGWYLDGIYEGLGTSITITMTQDHQLGAFFAGNIPSPSPTTQPTVTPTPIPTPDLPIPSLSFYCASSTITSGFNVQIQGALAINGTGITGTGVTFSYSATGGATWHDLAYIITDDYGDFSAVWMPSSSGNYVVKGVWLSDGVYSSVTTKVNFSVAPFQNQNQNVFSVSSNSTLSSLTFDSSQNKLSFSVSGPSGTMGYVQACIPKTLLTVESNLKVSLDGQDVTYYIFSEGDAWIITIGYHHSSHSVVMALDAPIPTPTLTVAPTSNPGQTSNPTANPTHTATASPTAASTPYAPEFPPIVIVPMLILMMSLAVFLMLKKRVKVNGKE
jgi:uncharacterized repeat protein (TIGR02543 family)